MSRKILDALLPLFKQTALAAMTAAQLKLMAGPTLTPATERLIDSDQ